MTGAHRPLVAMVLAAGLGTRMRPLTNRRPKALLEVAGRTLLDRAIDQAVSAGAGRVVVNVHHFAGQMRDHLAARRDVAIDLSEEAELLETGGGIRAALPKIGDRPFLALNCDSLWTDSDALRPLLELWPQVEADALLLLASFEQAVGHWGRGDFRADREGRLRRIEGEASGLIYTGAQMLDPRAFKGTPAGSWSMNLLWDRAIARRRLLGARLAAGRWIDAGTPQGLAAGEAALAA